MMRARVGEHRSMSGDIQILVHARFLGANVSSMHVILVDSICRLFAKSVWITQLLAPR